MVELFKSDFKIPSPRNSTTLVISQYYVARGHSVANIKIGLAQRALCHNRIGNSSQIAIDGSIPHMKELPNAQISDP